jgi:hypothetical protein
MPPGASLKWDRGRKSLSATAQNRRAHIGQPESIKCLEALPEALRRDLEKGKPVIAAVEVEKVGIRYRLLRLLLPQNNP